MIKTFPFRLDIEKEYNNRMHSVNSNDLKTVKFTFVVTDNGIPLNLTGLTVRIAIRKPDKKAVWQDCTVTNAPKGEVEVILDNQAYIKKGEHEAELMLYKGTNAVATTQKFYYRAAEGIMSDKSLKSETVLGPIDQKLAEVEETLNDIRENGTGIDAQARQDIDSVTTQLAEKASKQDIQQLSLAFKESYNTLAELQNAYPNGDNANHVVLADKMIYTYKNGWISTGIQGYGTGLGDGTVTKEKVDNNLFNLMTKGEYQQTVFNYNPEALNDVIKVDDISFVIDKPVDSVGTINTVRVSSTGGIVKVGVMRKVGENSFIALSVTDIMTEDGDKEYATDIPLPEKGLYISLSGLLKYQVQYSAPVPGAYEFWDLRTVVVGGEAYTNLMKSDLILTFAFKMTMTSQSDIKNAMKIGWTQKPLDYLNYVYGSEVSNTSPAATFILDKPVPKGNVRKVTIDSMVENSQATIKIFKKISDNSFEVLSITNFITKSGIETYNVNIPIPEDNLYIGIMGYLWHSTNGNPLIGFWDDYSNASVGSTITANKSDLKTTFGVKMEGYETSINEQSYKIYNEFQSIYSQIEEIQEKQPPIPSDNQLNLEYTLKPVWSEIFTEPNDDWVYENCTPNKGLLMSGVAKAYHNKYLTFDVYYHKANLKLLDVNSVFGLVNNNEQKGAVYIVDGIAKALKLYSMYTGGDLPTTIKAESPLSFNLVKDKEYIIEVIKIGWKHTFSITDLQTAQKTTVTFDNSTQATSADYAGKGWGSPGVISKSGQILVKNHSYSISNYPEAKVLFIGDSITEGTNMGANVDIKYRWCNQLREDLYKGNAMIAGRGGGTSSDLLVRLNDIYAIGIKTNIVVVLIGTNERSEGGLVGWKNSIVEIYDTIVSQGAVPVICVPPIPSSSADYIFRMRDFILDKGWNTIRFDYATTLNRDGVSYDPTLYTDGVHPNQKGSNAMHQQALIDLGFI